MTKELTSRQGLRPFTKYSEKTSLSEFAEIWANLCAAYPRSNPSKATLAKYHERLGKFPVDKLKAAVDAEIDRNPFFPAIAELIAAVEGLRPAPVALAAPTETRHDPRVAGLLSDLAEQLNARKKA